MIGQRVAQNESHEAVAIVRGRKPAQLVGQQLERGAPVKIVRVDDGERLAAAWRHAYTAWPVPQGLVRPCGGVKPAGTSLSSWYAYSIGMRPAKCGSMTDLNVSSISRRMTNSELAEPRADGVEDGVIDHDFAGRADGLDLLQPAVAAADSCGEDGEGGFVSGMSWR